MTQIIPMTHEEFMRLNKECHDRAYAITAIKNKDYSPGANPFANFYKSNELFAPYFKERGPMAAMMTDVNKKTSRITNFILTGERSKNNSEPFCNDFLDLSNYSVMLLVFAKTLGIDIFI